MNVVNIITLVSCILGMCVTIGSLIKPIINLNVSITKLNDIVSNLQGDMCSYKNDAKTFSTAIVDIQNKLSILEVKLEDATDKIKALEEAEKGRNK